MNSSLTPLAQRILKSNPLVVGDFQVLAHKVYSGLDAAVATLGLTGSPDFRERLLEGWIRSNWTALLNRLSPDLPLENYRLLLVNDRKQDGRYWRHDLYPAYKGDRPKKPEEFSIVLSIGLEIAAKMGVPVLSLPRFEADDLAGWLVANTSEPLVLLTVDTDWLQLVDDERVLWCNTAHWLPVLRGEAEAIAWAKRRHKWDISSARQIADMKSVYGDKADNLPPGADISLISLFEQPSEIVSQMDSHRGLWLSAVKGAPTVDNEWYSKSRYWCTKSGLGCII